MKKRRRYVHVPPDLTSLFDVLFILIFAALIRTAAVSQAAAQSAAPQPVSPLPPVKLANAQLQAAALADLGKQLASRPYVVVRISTSTMTSLEIGDKHIKLTTPLLEHNPDPDIAITYLGDRAAELRICRVIATQLAVSDLGNYLVIIAPDQHVADLPHALYDGLRRDIDRCLTDQQALAVLIDPSIETTGTSPPATPPRGAAP
jgi:hypothetical protein